MIVYKLGVGHRDLLAVYHLGLYSCIIITYIAELFELFSVSFLLV